MVLKHTYRTRPKETTSVNRSGIVSYRLKGKLGRHNGPYTIAPNGYISFGGDVTPSWSGPACYYPDSGDVEYLWRGKWYDTREEISTMEMADSI